VWEHKNALVRGGGEIEAHQPLKRGGSGGGGGERAEAEAETEMGWPKF